MKKPAMSLEDKLTIAAASIEVMQGSIDSLRMLLTQLTNKVEVLWKDRNESNTSGKPKPLFDLSTIVIALERMRTLYPAYAEAFSSAQQFSFLQLTNCLSFEFHDYVKFGIANNKLPISLLERYLQEQTGEQDFTVEVYYEAP